MSPSPQTAGARRIRPSEVLVVIPAGDEEPTIARVLSGARAAGFAVVVVDDDSSPSKRGYPGLELWHLTDLTVARRIVENRAVSTSSPSVDAATRAPLFAREPPLLPMFVTPPGR